MDLLLYRWFLLLLFLPHYKETWKQNKVLCSRQFQPVAIFICDGNSARRHCRLSSAFFPSSSDNLISIFLISRPKKLDDQIWIAICHDGMRTHTTSWRVLLIYFNSQIELQLHRKRSMNDDFYNVGSCDSKCALARFLGVLCVHYWKIIDNSLFMYRSLL